VTQEELKTAMGFLREQLGEDELRALLDRLNAWTQARAAHLCPLCMHEAACIH
jgi:hypothetical protein